MFNFLSGKLHRVFDEALDIFTELQQVRPNLYLRFMHTCNAYMHVHVHSNYSSLSHVPQSLTVSVTQSTCTSVRYV